MIEGYWRVRIGNVTVYDLDLSEALASMARINRYSSVFKGIRKP